MFNADVLDRFWKKVDKTTNPKGCWEWTATLETSGYGRFSVGNYKTMKAHRFSMLLTGQDPTGWEVMHSCDNPACVNPAHLSLGTHDDNMKDMAKKGRAVNNTPLKLSPQQVKEIINAPSKITHRELSKKYNINRDIISEIRRGVSKVYSK